MKIEKKKPIESNMINDFIEYNKGSVENIIDYIIGKKNKNSTNIEENKYIYKFLMNHTNYKEEIYNIRKYNINDDYDVISQFAKNKVLKKWCEKYNNYEMAISEKYLPNVLYKDINDIYNNNVLYEKDIDLENIKYNDMKCECIFLRS